MPVKGLLLLLDLMGPGDMLFIFSFSPPSGEHQRRGGRSLPTGQNHRSDHPAWLFPAGQRHPESLEGDPGDGAQ